MNWDQVGGFVLRTAMVEAVYIPLPNYSKCYQKCLILSWTVPMFILAVAYAGNMTALIAKPSLEKPIKDAIDFVNQNDMSLTMTTGDVGYFYFKTSSPGTLMRRIYDRVDKWSTCDCYCARDKPFWKSGQYAMPCSGVSVMSLRAYDYSETGLCNYYTTPDMFVKKNLALAFQVCLIILLLHACKYKFTLL